MTILHHQLTTKLNSETRCIPRREVCPQTPTYPGWCGEALGWRTSPGMCHTHTGLEDVSPKTAATIVDSIIKIFEDVVILKMSMFSFFPLQNMRMIGTSDY